MKWNCDIIRNTDTNEYRASVEREDGFSVDVYGDNWRDLCKNVRSALGITFPLKKYFEFSRLSDFEQIAGIDASHTRATCIVTMKDRFAGWMRERFC